METNSLTPINPSKKSAEQPRKHASKARLLTNYRHRKIVEACLSGKPLRQTGIELGLSPKTAGQQVSAIISKPEVQASFVRILEESGLSDKFLADKIRTLANAETTQYAQLDGQFTDKRSQPAWETQRKTAELVCRLKGHLSDSRNPDVSIGLMQVVVQAIAKNP